MSKNDITGDDIKSSVNSKAYADNFEKIFGKRMGTTSRENWRCIKCGDWYDARQTECCPTCKTVQ